MNEVFSPLQVACKRISKQRVALSDDEEGDANLSLPSEPTKPASNKKRLKARVYLRIVLFIHKRPTAAVSLMPQKELEKRKEKITWRITGKIPKRINYLYLTIYHQKSQ